MIPSFKIIRPFKGDFPITNPFGVYDPVAYANYPGQKHSGVDYALPMRTPLYAAMDGVTKIFDRDPSITTGRGKEVVIVNDRYQKKECHLDEIVIGRNANVKCGQLIGYSGSTGFSTGPHLHSEYLIDGQYVDQEKYMENDVEKDKTIAALTKQRDEVAEKLIEAEKVIEAVTKQRDEVAEKLIATEKALELAQEGQQLIELIRKVK